MENIKDMVFFADDNTEGIKLSSTNSNYIANLAKEYIQSTEAHLNNVHFLDINVEVIGRANKASIIQRGETLETLNSLQSLLKRVAQAKSLIAWLREGIKAKNRLIEHLNTISFEDWCKENKIVSPEIPHPGHILTKEEYYASLPIKERNRYYQLETEAAVLGKYIHPDGHLSNARKELKDRICHPNRLESSGADALIYTYTPTVSEASIDEAFYNLQNEHREIQAQLNAMKSVCEHAINESANKVNTEFITDSQKYQAELEKHLAAFKAWKGKKIQEYSKLKIVIPHSLMDIYNTINKLGK